MITKIITYNLLGDKDEEKIINLMDVFVKRQGIKRVTKGDIKRVMEQGINTLVVACENNKIVGLILLVEMNIFTAKVGLIEEVVVHEIYRNQGVATQMLQKIIEIAREKKMDYLKLNTNVKNPSNKLYQKFGFMLKDDNLYKLIL
jgi:ribosomal protein S18 acetylase RimI-like enzyme